MNIQSWFTLGLTGLISLKSSVISIKLHLQKPYFQMRSCFEVPRRHEFWEDIIQPSVVPHKYSVHLKGQGCAENAADFSHINCAEHLEQSRDTEHIHTHHCYSSSLPVSEAGLGASHWL